MPLSLLIVQEVLLSSQYFLGRHGQPFCPQRSEDLFPQLAACPLQGALVGGLLSPNGIIIGTPDTQALCRTQEPDGPADLPLAVCNLPQPLQAGGKYPFRSGG